MLCKGCRLVKYCSKDCQIEHRPAHRKACKRRAAELHEEALFRPPPKAEDCPICFLLLPESVGSKSYMSCCGKIICRGCFHADCLHAGMKQNPCLFCPFCRTECAKTDAELIEREKKRLKVNDPWAFYNMGSRYFLGGGVVQNKSKGLEYYFLGAELGSSDALNAIAKCYHEGNGAEKDEKKAMYYNELAAIQGHSSSRHNLGFGEYKAGKYDIALKHWMIACGRGHVGSLSNIKHLFIDGRATKDDYEKALRSFQEYIDEIKSDARDEAAASDEMYRYLPLQNS
jgi:hypothetical protein